ncbi:MAG: DUF2085 domain-containing protein [Acidobacteriota bacterium]|nr:DUF2085 domain-containing protein [Acidobacteriota bacterium]
MNLPANQYIPQMGTNSRPLLMWLIVASGSLAVMAIIIGAPLALAAGHGGLAATIYQAFSHVCHQLPERSFFIHGHPFAVCARCTGIYAGFAVAAVLYPLTRSLRQTEAPARKWLFIAAAPLAIDFAIEFSGTWHNTHSSRLFTGALLGAVAVFYVMPGLLDLSLRRWKRVPEGPADIGTSHAKEVSPAEVFSTPASAPSDYSSPHRRI